VVGAPGDQPRCSRADARLLAAAEAVGRGRALRARGGDAGRRAPPDADGHEIAEDLDISEADVEALIRIGVARRLAERASWRAEDGEDGPELGDLLPQEVVPPAESALIRRRLNARVHAALHELDPREREVMELRFGLDAATSRARCRKSAIA
jgi:hypothetical protein